jgi:multicomponent Na+:H+ antiporter subunit E
MKTLGFLVSFLLAYAFWLFLNLSLGWQVLLEGALAALAVAAVSSRVVFPSLEPSDLNPLRALHALAFALVFLKAAAIANLKVAWIILSGAKVRPGVVRLEIVDVNDAVTAGVANAITLTPGTLAVDARKGTLYVHMINVERDRAKAKEAAVGGFEGALRGVFG